MCVDPLIIIHPDSSPVVLFFWITVTAGSEQGGSDRSDSTCGYSRTETFSDFSVFIRLLQKVFLSINVGSVCIQKYMNVTERATCYDDCQLGICYLFCPSQRGKQSFSWLIWHEENVLNNEHRCFLQLQTVTSPRIISTNKSTVISLIELWESCFHEFKISGN